MSKSKHNGYCMVLDTVYRKKVVAISVGLRSQDKSITEAHNSM